MVDSLGSRTPLPSAELVGNRISEKRLFEARFLFNKFSEEIDPTVRLQLQQQLAAGISQAEQSFAAGEQLERSNDFEKAMAAYADVAALVVDHPGLAEAQQRVALAIQLGGLQSIVRTEPEVDSDFLSSLPSASPQMVPGHQSAASVSVFSSRKRIIFLSLGLFLLCMLGLVTGWMYFSPEDMLEVSGKRLPAREERNRGERVVAHSALEPISESDIIPPLEKSVLFSSQLTSSNEAAREFLEGEVGTRKNKPAINDRKISQNNVQSPSPLQKSRVEKELLVGKQGKSSSELIMPPPSSVLANNTGISPEKQSAALQKFGHEESAAVPSAQGEEQPVETKANGTEKKNTPQAVPLAPKSSLDDSLSIAEVPGEDSEQSSGSIKKYTVRSGDTLETIARKIYGDRYKWSYLVAANQEKLGQPPYLLSVGMQLAVPPFEVKRGSDLLNDDGTYTVQSGDTLGSISRKIYGSSKKWHTLYNLNRDKLPTPGALEVGQILWVDKKGIATGEDRLPEE
jgi:nucleoid-associated protein YgaU